MACVLTELTGTAVLFFSNLFHSLVAHPECIMVELRMRQSATDRMRFQREGKTGSEKRGVLYLMPLAVKSYFLEPGRSRRGRRGRSGIPSFAFALTVTIHVVLRLGVFTNFMMAP